MIQRVMKVYLKKKRANLILLEGDSPKRVNNTKLQDELNLASNPDKRNSTKSMKPQKISNQLNNLNVNDENDKSKMIEQLMEISIVTKHTKDINESHLNSVHNSGYDLDKASMLYKKHKKRAVGDRKIEDKLIEYGENMKKKRAEKKIQKLKDEETQLIFKPQTNQINLDNSKLGGCSFLERMNYLKIKTENKIKDLRSKKVDINETECSFQPKLTEKAKKQPKRTVDNLLNWKQKKDEDLNKRIKEKLMKEDKELEELTKKSVVNKYSEYLLSQKTKEKNTTQNNNTDFEDIDLWPVQMTKAYFEKN